MLAKVADISYSVNRALKFSANTASTLGRMMGSFTCRKVRKPRDPRFRAASSSSSSMA